MKPLTILLFLSIVAPCCAQNNEFNVSSNGLIYSDTTVKQLKFIVDSLNLKFKVCELNKKYLSNYQGKAHFISLQEGKIKQAMKDITANISFEDFIAKYSPSEIEKDMLVVKFKYKNYEDIETIEFSTIALSGRYSSGFEFTEHLENYDQQLKGTWVYKHYKKTRYNRESLEAFYFVEDLTTQAIPEAYARLIQYADCLIDTSSVIYTEKANNSQSAYKLENPALSFTFIEYIHTSTKRPQYNPDYDEDNYNEYLKNLHVWDSLRISRVDSLRRVDKNFDVLLQEAIKDGLNNGTTFDEFEEYVGRYYSKKTALEMKRNRKVFGMCSMDVSPRIHALNIAKLSAETVNWEIFLRSHLDIVNDQFERLSDGNYAWGERKTYIKELEVLDINVLDLLLGISLRINNPSENHYYGSVSRVGRALSETSQSAAIEAMMLQMIADPKLDNYNRILMYFLFLNYNFNLANEEHIQQNKEKLRTAVQNLPAFLSEKITID